MKRIIVNHTEATIALNLKTILKNFEVVYCPGAICNITDVLRTDKFDLVLLDIDETCFSLETVKQILSEYDIPVLLISFLPLHRLIQFRKLEIPLLTFPFGPRKLITAVEALF